MNFGLNFATPAAVAIPQALSDHNWDEIKEDLRRRQQTLLRKEQDEKLLKKQKKLGKKFAKLEKKVACTKAVATQSTSPEKEVPAAAPATVVTEMKMTLGENGSLVNHGTAVVQAENLVQAPPPKGVDLEDYSHILQMAIQEGSDPKKVEADYRSAAGLPEATEETSLVPAAIAAVAAADPNVANTALGHAMMNHGRGRNRQRGQNHGRGQNRGNKGNDE